MILQFKLLCAYGSNYLSLMSGREQHQQSFNDTYTALIIEEAEKLYNDLTTKLTNEVMEQPEPLEHHRYRYHYRLIICRN